jgi:hypothetical protein
MKPETEVSRRQRLLTQVQSLLSEEQRDVLTAVERLLDVAATGAAMRVELANGDEIRVVCDERVAVQIPIGFGLAKSILRMMLARVGVLLTEATPGADVSLYGASGLLARRCDEREVIVQVVFRNTLAEHYLSLRTEA